MTMDIVDIHTHLLPEQPGRALVCIGCGPVPESDGQFYSAGLHPWDVTGCDDEQFRVLEQLLAMPQVLAVGECGFDTLKGPAHDLQERAFVRQVELSERLHKPMILHVVRDFDSVIRLRKKLKPTQSWLIHGFRGGPRQTDQLHAQGILVSLGLHCNPQTLKQIPSDRLYLETDGKSSITEVIQSASTLRNVPAESIENQLILNTEGFLLHRPYITAPSQQKEPCICHID